MKNENIETQAKFPGSYIKKSVDGILPIIKIIIIILYGEFVFIFRRFWGWETKTTIIIRRHTAKGGLAHISPTPLKNSFHACFCCNFCLAIIVGNVNYWKLKNQLKK